MGGMLVEGQWLERGHWETDRSGAFLRQRSAFRERVEARAEAPFPVEAGRYHLYVSYACPWAHRVLVARALLGLEQALSVTVVDPLMGDDGWAFRDDEGHPRPDPLCGAQHLREIYVATQPDFTGRVTVPVLFDRRSARIVSNESRDILEMLDSAFRDLAERDVQLYPSELRTEIDATIDAIYEPINNGVYRCGFARRQEAYDRAFDELFEALDHWDGVLSRQRYLCGARLTAADLCLLPTLYRFDAVYHLHFKCSERRIADYAHLGGYLRELYQLPGVAATCRMDHVKRHYYLSHRQLNPSGLVPRGPDVEAWLGGAHDRDRLEGGPPPALLRGR